MLIIRKERIIRHAAIAGAGAVLRRINKAESEENPTATTTMRRAGTGGLCVVFNPITPAPFGPIQRRIRATNQPIQRFSRSQFSHAKTHGYLVGRAL